MPHNRVMPADRSLPVRLVSALLAMTGVMLIVAAVGEWLLIPSVAVRELDEGGVARATALLTEVAGLQDAAELWSVLTLPLHVQVVVAVVAVALVGFRRVEGRALLVVPIGLVGWGLEVLCKKVVERPRPDLAVVEIGSWAYPSGHATNIALGAVLLIALLQAVRTAWVRWVATTLILVVVCLTAADRLVLGVHYPTDVLAGLVLGVAMALVGLRLVGAVVTPTHEGRHSPLP